MRRLRTTACGKFETLEKYVFEHGEQDETGPEFSAGPSHQKKMDNGQATFDLLIGVPTSKKVL